MFINIIHLKCMTNNNFKNLQLSTLKSLLLIGQTGIYILLKHMVYNIFTHN